jgi:hypothetical protein
MTPDRMADTWLGAMACELGSQTCSGMIPALIPKPTRARTKTAVAIPGVRLSSSSETRSNEPLDARSRAKRANRASTATCEAAR